MITCSRRPGGAFYSANRVLYLPRRLLRGPFSYVSALPITLPTVSLIEPGRAGPPRPMLADARRALGEGERGHSFGMQCGDVPPLDQRILPDATRRFSKLRKNTLSGEHSIEFSRTTLVIVAENRS